MTDKSNLLLRYIAKGIDPKWVKELCQVWAVDAKFLPISRGIDVMATLERLADHALNSEPMNSYAIIFNGDSLDVL